MECIIDALSTLYYKIVALRKHFYSNILKILPPKWKFSDKNSDIFHISAQNIDYGHSLVPTIYVFEQK